MLATRSTHGIYFVDKHDARRFFLSLTEKVAHTRCTHSHKHFHKVGTRKRKERYISLTCHSLSQKGLTGSRRAHKQCSLWNLTAKIGICVGIFQEIHYFSHFGLSLSQAGYVLEGHFRGIVLIEQLGFRLAYTEHAAVAATGSARHAIHNPKPEHHKKHKRSERPQQLTPHAAARFVLHLAIEFSGFFPFVDFRFQAVARGDASHHFRFIALARSVTLEQFLGERIGNLGLHLILYHHNRLHTLALNVALKFRPRHFLLCRHVTSEKVHAAEHRKYHGIHPIDAKLKFAAGQFVSTIIHFDLLVFSIINITKHAPIAHLCSSRGQSKSGISTILASLHNSSSLYISRYSGKNICT